MSNDTHLAINYADAVNSNLEEIWANVESFDSPDAYEIGTDRSDAREEALDALNELPLELISRRGSLYAVVITLGGPDARIVWDGAYGTDSAELVVRWGGDKATRTSDAIRRTAEYFGELMSADEE